MVVLAHVDIGAFSAYRDGYMQKNLPKLRTYAAVLETFMYVAMHKVF